LIKNTLTRAITLKRLRKRGYEAMVTYSEKVASHLMNRFIQVPLGLH